MHPRSVTDPSQHDRWAELACALHDARAPCPRFPRGPSPAPGPAPATLPRGRGWWDDGGGKRNHQARADWQTATSHLARHGPQHGRALRATRLSEGQVRPGGRPRARPGVRAPASECHGFVASTEEETSCRPRGRAPAERHPSGTRRGEGGAPYWLSLLSAGGSGVPARRPDRRRCREGKPPFIASSTLEGVGSQRPRLGRGPSAAM